MAYLGKKSLLSSLFTSLGSGVLKGLFPPRCYACRDFLFDRPDPFLKPEGATDYFTELLAPFLCPDCAKAFKPIESPYCPCCGILFYGRTSDDHLCGACLQEPKHFEMARAAGVYETTLMTLIQRLKYELKMELAPPLGRLLGNTFIRFWKGAAVDLLIPVPLHLRRERKRGFNQAYQLVRSWQDLRHNPALLALKKKLTSDILYRTRPTPPQTGLGRSARLKNIRGAFAVRDGVEVEGKRILLVDDVYTTGATVGECARILKKAGAGCVDVLTLARAL